MEESHRKLFHDRWYSAMLPMYEGKFQHTQGVPGAHYTQKGELQFPNNALYIPCLKTAASALDPHSQILSKLLKHAKSISEGRKEQMVLTGAIQRPPPPFAHRYLLFNPHFMHLVCIINYFSSDVFYMFQQLPLLYVTMAPTQLPLFLYPILCHRSHSHSQ